MHTTGASILGTFSCAWIKAMFELEADVHVQTLELVASYYKTSMESVFTRLNEVLHIHEYIIWKGSEAAIQCPSDELCVDLLKEAKRVSIMEYCLTMDDEEEEGMKNVLDFAFSAREREELYVAVEMHDGSRLLNQFLRRFRELQSTCQMVSTFTWEWGLGCDCPVCRAYEDDWLTALIDFPKSIAEAHVNAFKDVTHHRRHQLDPVQYAIAVGQRSGDVYEFKNEHDGTYLRVVIAKEDKTVQFRKGRFELVEVAADHSPDKKRRLSDNHDC